ncbi:MAG: carbohydrate kinase family protein [Armatimonadota bacterium]
MSAPHEVISAGILVADHVSMPMEHLPAEGELVAVPGMSLTTGGCAANVAIDLACQGVRVGISGKVGSDVWGRFIREDLAEHGVATEHLAASETEQTSQSLVLLVKGQDRRFVHSFGANGDFRVSDIPREQVCRSKVFYLGGYLLMPAFDPDELGALFRHCREQGVRNVLDVVVPSGYTAGGELEPVLPHTDVFMPNNDEAAILTGETEPVRQAEACRALGARTVIVTQGGDGLVVAHEDEIWKAYPFPSVPIDATGAGDAFCAGFITGMVRGLDLRGCLEYGSALGASCVRSLGACAGVFNAEETAQFLREHALELQRVR